MATKDAKEQLTRILKTYVESIQDTFQLLNEPPPSSLEKVHWDEVTTIAQQISKQATIAGMLWSGAAPDLKELEECMSTYFKMLQGLLLLSNGSTIGAGPTLRSCIHASAKKIVDCSLALLKEAVSSHGSRCKNQHLSIPQLAGNVWNACDSLKKTPTTNYTAIRRAITQVELSVKDVLRELKELKPASTDSEDETGDGVDADASQSDESSTGGDLGDNLSAEEMKITEFAVSFVSDTLVVIKELIRFIASLLKRPDHSETSQSVKSLERLLELSQGIGLQVDELGACLYPPQELSAIKAASDKIYIAVDEMKAEVISFHDSSENFCHSCENCDESQRELQSNLKCSDAVNLVSILENLELNM